MQKLPTSIKYTPVRGKGLFVDLGCVDDKARGRVELLVAVHAFKVLRFLMGYQYLFIIKFPITIPRESQGSTGPRSIYLYQHHGLLEVALFRRFVINGVKETINH